MSSSVLAPVLGFAAYSGVGKTTLLERLIPLLRARDLRVGLLKKSHHDFEIDRPGKDSHRLRLAGASPVMVASPFRRVLITEFDEPCERSLQEELVFFAGAGVDLILVEGYRHERFPKIELHRPSLSKPLLYPTDSSVIALATDELPSPPPPIPLLDLNSPPCNASFIMNEFLAQSWS